MKYIYIIIIAFVLPSLNAISQPTEWEASGIGAGGAMFFPSISPFDDSDYYITSDMRDIFHSTNQGESWTPIPFYELTGAGHKTKINFTSNADILYALGYVNSISELYISTDAGITWELLNEPSSGNKYCIFPDDDRTDRFITSTWNDLYITSDGGDHYTNPFHNGVAGGLHIAGVFWDDSNIFVGTNRGLLVSHDNGANFSFEDDVPADVAMTSFAGNKADGTYTFYCTVKEKDYNGGVYAGISTTKYYGASGPNYLYRLEYNSGNGWELNTNGLQPTHIPALVATCKNNADTVYAGGYAAWPHNGPMVFQTTDGGESWHEVFLIDGNENIKTGWIGEDGDLDWPVTGFALGLNVAPNNPNVLIVTDYFGAHTSVDGGANWQQVYAPPADSNTENVNTPQNQYYHSNGLEVTSSWWISWLNQDDMFAGYSDITGIISHDGGDSWAFDYNYSTDYNSTYHVAKHPDNGNLYASVSSVHDMYGTDYLGDDRIDNGTGEILISTDNGNNWSTLYNFAHPVIWMTIDPNNTTHFYASVIHSTQGGIYYSDNSGSSWSKLADPPRTEGHAFNIHILNDGTLVCSYSGRVNSSGVFTESSGVFVSTNNGQTWLDRSNSDMYFWTRDIIIDPHDSNQNTWYSCVFSNSGNSNGGVYRTLDRGVTWSKINSVEKAYSLTINPENQDVAYLSSSVDGLFYTSNLTDSNPTFNLLPEYHFSKPTRVFYNPYNYNEVWVTSFGNGLKRANDTITSVEEPNRKGRNKSASVLDNPNSNAINIYPNPASQYLIVDNSSGSTEESVVTIYNISGKKILQKKYNTRTRISTDKFINGIYLIRNEQNKQVTTNKIRIINGR